MFRGDSWVKFGSHVCCEKTSRFSPRCQASTESASWLRAKIKNRSLLTQLERDSVRGTSGVDEVPGKIGIVRLNPDAGVIEGHDGVSTSPFADDVPDMVTINRKLLKTSKLGDKHQRRLALNFYRRHERHRRPSPHGSPKGTTRVIIVQDPIQCISSAYRSSLCRRLDARRRRIARRHRINYVLLGRVHVDEPSEVHEQPGQAPQG